MNVNTTTTYPAPAEQVRVTSTLKPSDRQQEFGRLLIKAMRQFAAGIGTLVMAFAFYYGVPVD